MSRPTGTRQINPIAPHENPCKQAHEGAERTRTAVSVRSTDWVRMTPFVNDPDFVLHVGDALDVLATLPDESVHCVVTSPPYWGLRDYGTGSWDGGDDGCDHAHKNARNDSDRLDAGLGGGHGGGTTVNTAIQFRDVCGKCSARRVDHQLGLEPTPEEYVSSMVAVFREVRRVLRRDGTCWLNIGDSYASNWPCNRRNIVGEGSLANGKREARPPRMGEGLKDKDLCGIPWRLAFALQADGWYLRSDIIWSKPNPMPESVTDRPTKAHEFVFLLTKGEWKGPEKGRFCDLSESDKRWLALLVDAEGNICVKRVAPKDGKSPQYGAQVAIGSTSRALLERVQKITGCGNVNERPGTNAPMFYWQASNKVARDLLYAIYPHLIVKPRQARIAMHLESLLYHRGNATMRTDRENAALESLWTRNKGCNQFGDPDLSDVPEPRYGRWGPTRYFYDADAIREPAELRDYASWDERKANGEPRRRGFDVAMRPGNVAGLAPSPIGRNKRSVWEIATEPYPDAHFATFPQALVEPCVLAGTSERGCCPVCGAPWERETERETVREHGGTRDMTKTPLPVVRAGWRNGGPSSATVGWHPTCLCETLPEGGRGAGPAPSDSVPCTVLDPFMGSGTVAVVARRLGRRAVGIELNPEYALLASKRLAQLSLLAA